MSSIILGALLLSQQLTAKQVIERERYKTNAAGAAGVLVGVGAGEFIGNMIAKQVAGKRPKTGDIRKGAQASLVTKLVIGIVIMILNTATGFAGVIIMGISWGFIGSIVTDVVLATTDMRIHEHAFRATVRLQQAYAEARESGGAEVEWAGQRNKQIPPGLDNPNRPPISVVNR